MFALIGDKEITMVK